MLRPTPSPAAPNTWRVTVTSDNSGVTRELMSIGLRALDRYRLRGELRLVSVETTTQDALQRWARPEHMRRDKLRVAAEQHGIVETPSGGWRLG